MKEEEIQACYDSIYGGKKGLVSYDKFKLKVKDEELTSAQLDDTCSMCDRLDRWAKERWYNNSDEGYQPQSQWCSSLQHPS